ncbi:MAG: FMN-binding protein [Gemmatimonadota bacterium]
MSVSRRLRGASRWAAVLVVLTICAPAPAAGQVFLTQQEALELAFPPPMSVERRTAFLSEADLSRADELAGSGSDVDQRIVSYYVGTLENQAQGVAYYDAHRVRTLPEAIMIVVGPEGEVTRVEILKFAEPRDYLASAAWLKQFEGRRLDADVSIGRGVARMTGATLTSRAVTSAVRRVLALHELIKPFGPTP